MGAMQSSLARIQELGLGLGLGLEKVRYTAEEKLVREQLRVHSSRTEAVTAADTAGSRQ